MIFQDARYEDTRIHFVDTDCSPELKVFQWPLSQQLSVREFKGYNY